MSSTHPWQAELDWQRVPRLLSPFLIIQILLSGTLGGYGALAAASAWLWLSPTPARYQAMAIATCVPAQVTEKHALKPTSSANERKRRYSITARHGSGDGARLVTSHGGNDARVGDAVRVCFAPESEPWIEGMSPPGTSVSLSVVAWLAVWAAFAWSCARKMRQVALLRTGRFTMATPSTYGPCAGGRSGARIRVTFSDVDGTARECEVRATSAQAMTVRAVGGAPLLVDPKRPWRATLLASVPGSLAVARGGVVVAGERRIWVGAAAFVVVLGGNVAAAAALLAR